MDILVKENFKQLEKLYHFLMRYYSIWEKEVLNYYPESYKSFPADWIKQVLELSEKDKWLIDSKISFAPLEGTSLGSLLSEINELSNFVKNHNEDNPNKLTASQKFGVKIKKQHEIEQILNFLEKEKNKDPNRFPKAFLDIGGGKGHLSRNISERLKMSGVCLEMNKSFISSGEQLLKNNKIKLRSITFPQNESDKGRKIIIDNRSSAKDLCIGLHTCGPLANSIIKAGVASSQENILNFGCCYLKLKPGLQVGISKASKKLPLPLSKYALTLATRAHTGLSWADFQTKRKVKRYRYGLHLYLYYQMQEKTFTAVGDGKDSDYEAPFSSYVNKKLNYLGHQPKTEKDDIDKWFHQDVIQQKIDEMFCMNIIRWQFGRALELWILLDRACYLEENGFKAYLGEYFDEKISPRNIGIYAKLLADK